MNRLTDFLFRATDTLAWVIVTLGVISIVATPFTEPEYYALKGEDVAWGETSLKMLITAVLTLGFYLLIIRKVVGFLLISAAFIASAVVTASTLSLLILALILIIFASPWLLSWKEARNQPTNQAD